MEKWKLHWTIGASPSLCAIPLFTSASQLSVLREGYWAIDMTRIWAREEEIIVQRRGMNKGSTFSIRHLFCCFPNYYSLLLPGKVIKPKANELEHPLVFVFLSRQDWVLHDSFCGKVSCSYKELHFPMNHPVLSPACNAAFVGLQRTIGLSSSRGTCSFTSMLSTRGVIP